jgi:hypothetical protein
MQHALVLFVLLAATPSAQRPVEMVGMDMFPARLSNDVRTAAAAAGVDIIAVELLKGDFLSIPIAYGPMTARPNAICRGTLYGIEIQGEGGSEQTRIVPFGDDWPEMTYAVEARTCPKSIRSRIMVSGATSDSELAAILEAVRKRKVAQDQDGDPIPVDIGKNLVVDEVEHTRDDKAEVVMVDRASREHQLNVLLFRFGRVWLIWHAAPGATWGR